MLGTLNGLIHYFFIIITDISSAAITTVSIHEDYVRITPLTIDATPVIYMQSPLFQFTKTT